MITTLSQVLAIVAVLANAIVYGTDVFAALVMRPMYARLDDGTVTKVAGWGHFYGDRRMPIPGVAGVVSAILAVILAVVGGRTAAAIAGAVAVVALLGWLAVYVRVNKPVNSLQTAAARAGNTPVDARALQDKWESVINLRVLLQGLAVAALCTTLALP